MSGKFKFSWADRKTWPVEGKDYVFLADAVLRVGAHMFPEEWRWEDVYARPLALPNIDLEQARGDHLSTARLLLLATRRVISAPVEFNDDLWREALAESERQVPAAIEARERANAAKEIVRKSCVQESLVSALKWEHDGTYHDLKPTLWTLPKTREWFESGQIAGRDVFSSSSHGDYHWLFIRRDRLDSLTETRPSPSPSVPARDGYTSPYMDLMFDVIREFSIDEENQAKVDTIKAYLEKQWPLRGFKDSDNLRRAIATLVRLPESQDGGWKNRTKKNGSGG
ncbi:MAG: hypothetical protein EOR01_07705 [Mesorhizobium sp.]|uniref:hypothetical protein n=1 Tax=Mesorhizobium sp. TaxID=1871066 RepID=UPI000FE45560|nr:hypothetical protein [Mesorhizobium sp.]RWP23764.1 MAG: hypothetical protein EOR01_07705 [Mesorhizobium sp.]